MANEELNEETELTPEGRKHDIFEDPAITRSLKEDPILRAVVKWWRPIVVVLVAAFALMYGRARFTETWNASRGESAGLLDRTSSLLAEVQTATRDYQDAVSAVAKAGKNDEALEKKVNESEVAVKEKKRKLAEAIAALGDAQLPYRGLADLYRGMLAVRNGDFEQVKGALASAAAISQSKDDEDQFYSELGALVLARALLDDEKEEAQGRNLLKDLSKRGRFVYGSAAISLARIALTPEDRAEAKAIIEGIIASHPEQAEILNEEYARVKA